MPVGFGLVVHRLGRRRDRVLAVGFLAGARSEDGWFSPGDIAALFESLRLPRPGNISQELARLRDKELVVRRGTGGSWSLTPMGLETAKDMIGEVDAAQVDVEMAAAGTASFAGVEHPLIPPELAPLRFQPAINRLLDVAPFERNVFCMTRFPSDETDPIDAPLRTMREVLAEHGLTMHLASDRNSDDELFGNVAAHIWGCKYGIAVLETLGTNGDNSGQLNDNVLIEIGAMLVSGRRCGLLKDPGAPSPPTDFVAQIYREVNITDPSEVEAAVTGWVVDDLQLGS